MGQHTAMKRVPRLTTFGLFSLLLLACDDDGPPTGEAQGACYPNGTCNEGLVCASDLCVDQDGGGESDSGASESESESETSAEESRGESAGDSGSGDDAGTTGTSTTGDSTTTTTTTTTTGGDSNDSSSECPTPGCSAYASKLEECFPMLDVDWYAECLYVYDVCDAAGCLPGTAGQVACVNSRPCPEVIDGVCNDGMQC